MKKINFILILSVTIFLSGCAGNRASSSEVSIMASPMNSTTPTAILARTSTITPTFGQTITPTNIFPTPINYPILTPEREPPEKHPLQISYINAPRVDPVAEALFLVNLAGTDKRQLTQEGLVTQGYSWSPDGQWIAFTKPIEKHSELHIVRADGTDLRLLVPAVAQIGGFSWSHDSKRIVFVSNGDGDDEIYDIDIRTGRIRQLTFNEVDDWGPECSPSGGQIVFVSDRNGTRDIYLMDADGGNERRLTHDPFAAENPSWSPDAKWIAFSSFQSDSYEIHVMDAEGKNRRKLGDTNYAPLAIGFSWSPDSGQIAFVDDRVGDIFLVNVDGSNLTQLTHLGNPVLSSVAWSPDEKWILFTILEGGFNKIMLISVDGGEVRYLLDSDTTAVGAAWRP